jgi:hypothetical protein
MSGQFTFHKEQQAFKDAIVGGYKKRIAVAAARRCGKSELIARTMIGIAATTRSNILIYVLGHSHHSPKLSRCTVTIRKGKSFGGHTYCIGQ